MPRNSLPNNEENSLPETEQELVALAQTAVSRCNWVVGQCAAEWTVRYAKGRTDADFAGLVGLSPDQVYQRRRVWETFGDVADDYPSLKWSHFYVALSWDDAPECLQWADENEATVSEMKAWRRAMRGEDLSAEPASDTFGGDPAVAYVPSETTPVRNPGEFGGGGPRGPAGEGAAESEPAETVAGVARQAEGQDERYAPYRQGAGSPAPQESSGGGGTATAERPEPSAEQLLKRITSAVERAGKSLTPERIAELKELPEKKRDRLVKAVAELSSKTAGLM